ncbi:MAG: hypothetical protein M3R38_27335 [Actinomycetota bacterium]|nr:hypothetical protein [Actinomycetota bacterium]MDP9485045.1 hypothetical protein [Actinomycetota bacterium]
MLGELDTLERRTVGLPTEVRAELRSIQGSIERRAAVWRTPTRTVSADGLPPATENPPVESSGNDSTPYDDDEGRVTGDANLEGCDDVETGGDAYRHDGVR